MNLSQRYRGSKGHPEYRQEEPPLNQLGALPLVEGGGAKHSPPGQYEEIHEKCETMKNSKLFKVHRNDREVFRKYLGHLE